MIKVATFILAILMSFSASAESRQDKIARLMKAQGIAEMFEQQMQYGKLEGEKQARKMLDQVLAGMNPNEEYKKRFSSAFMNYTKKLESPWSSQEIAAAWSTYYGSKFSDGELDQLLKFYESPLGQKEKTASKEALVQFSDHFRKLGGPIVEKATAEYITELKITAKECRCSK